MAKKERWGEKYVDKRDWKVYNKQLVKRGEFYINLSFLETWLEEIKELNYCKVGEPYLYPNSMIEFLSTLHSKSFDYRALEGIMGGLSRRLENFPVISFSQIRRRIRKLKPSFKPKKKNLFVGVDGTGEKVSNRDEWIRQKYKKRRGWIKVVIMGDTEGNIVDIRIGEEDFNENPAGREMLLDNYEYIDKYSGDALYDTRDNFNLCNQLGVEPVIKIRKSASTKSKGCMARKKEVLRFQELGYKDWAKEKDYGKRWVATEGIFSAKKRIFGEYVKSHKKENMYHEAKLKYWVYQKLKDYGMS